MATITEHYHFLNPVNGWCASESRRSKLRPRPHDGALMLPALSGQARPLLNPKIVGEPCGSLPGKKTKGSRSNLGSLCCPSAVAAEPCGSSVLVIDATLNRVNRIRLRSEEELLTPTNQGFSQPYIGSRIDTITAFGGLGSEPRKFRHPRGLARLRSGIIAVSDTGNHRIQLFSPSPHVLLQVWGATDTSGKPIIGTEAKQFHSPTAMVTDHESDFLYIADQCNKRVQRISADGARVHMIGDTVLKRPSRLAIGPRQLLAVVDTALSCIFLFSPHVPLPGILSRIEAPRSVAFDRNGTLYIGTGKGRIIVFQPSNSSPVEYDLIDESSTHIDGEILDLVWVDPDYLIATIRHTVNGSIKQTLHWLRTTEGCVTEGHLVIGPLDSGIDRCQWHRIEMQAAIPEGTSLQLATVTSDTLHSEPPRDPSQKGLPPAQNSLPQWSIEASAGEHNPDWLVQNGPGRYLWLRITVRSNGQASPVITWIKTHYPRNSYLQYLPALYQEDEESRNFLDRFLSLFQREFDTLDRKLDNVWQLFEPGSTTDIFSDRSAEQADQKRSVPFEQRRLQWLAGWMGLTLNPEWSEVKLREMLRKTARAYTQRGTVGGLETAITDYAQVGFAKILEHHRIRRWPVLLERQPSSNTTRPSTPLDGSIRLWSPNFYQRLQVSSNSQIGTFRLTGRPEPAAEPFDWGAHIFSVFFPAHPYTREKTERAVKAAVSREKPAHTKAVLCPVFPRMRVGIQATLGVNSVVGAITHTVLGKVATLSYDTILGCSEEERNIRSLKTSPRPRVGISTRFP